MIFRAVFCLALVAVLIPREPDLGFGRPASAFAPSRSLEALLARTSGPSTSIMDGFRARLLEGLATVKADIERDQKARSESGAL